MEKLPVKIKLTRNVPMPEYATVGSAAIDLRAAIDETILLRPGEKTIIPTGIALSTERNDIVAVIAGRSGLGVKYGVTLSNAIGVIDSDYRGEICVGLINHGKDDFTVNPLDRIAQLLFLPVYTADFIQVDTLDLTERGCGGFGHTGLQ